MENPGKRIALLENEHIKTFAMWLHKEVMNHILYFNCLFVVPSI